MSTIDQSPSTTSVVSKRATPQAPPTFIRVQGSTCFCPLSAIAANHGPDFDARSQVRIVALPDLFA